MIFKGVKGCLLIGCLGVPVLLIGGCFVFWGVAITIEPMEAEYESVSSSHDLPGLPTTIDDPDALARELSALPGGGAGRVVLDVSMAEFRLEPGDPGEPIRLDADYDRAHFDLIESLEESEDGWTYRLTFENSVSLFRFVRIDHDTAPRLVLYIPPGLPFDLEGEIGMTESRLELGGLPIRRVDLELGAGEHEVSFSEPTPNALTLFRIDGSFGDLRFDQIGNASPHTTQVDATAGSLRLDLEGAWRNDGEVRVDFGFGEATVALPRDVPAQVEGARVRIGERRIRNDVDLSTVPPEQPKLHVWAKGTAGELRID